MKFRLPRLLVYVLLALSFGRSVSAMPESLAGLFCSEVFSVPPRGSASRLIRFNHDNTFRILASVESLNGRLLPAHPGATGAYSYQRTTATTARVTLGSPPNAEVVELTFRDATSGTRNRLTLDGGGFLGGNFRLLAGLDQGAVANQSARGFVVPGRPMSSGLVVTKPCFVLLRAVGPTLRVFGIASAARDPALSVALADGRALDYGQDDDWETREMDRGIPGVLAAYQELAALVGAFPLAAGSKDAALLLYVQPGAYVTTATVKAGDEGEILLETYVIHALP